MFFPRQHPVSPEQLFVYANSCSELPQKEVFITSSVGTMSKIDTSRCKIVKEPLLTNQIVLFFRKNHYLVEAVDNVIGIFKSSGLNDYWIAKYSKKIEVLIESGPKVMTAYDLSGTIKIFFVGSMISAVAFVCEVLYNRFH